MGKTEPADKLNVIARGPFNIRYEGSAECVTSSNQVGEFDILPGHADFFSVLSPGEVTITTGSNPVNFSIANGIITVQQNEVMLFVNI